MAKVPDDEKILKKQSKAVGAKITQGQVKNNFLEHMEFMVEDDGN